MSTPTEHLDVVVVGAGLSGIGAAYRLQTECPGTVFAVLEARDVMGGTWDLFRYPGVRSDSDMFTLGYEFKPWRAEKAIADGPTILELHPRDGRASSAWTSTIRYRTKVVGADWSSARPALDAAAGDAATGPQTLTCEFLYSCAGYYDYDEGYTPGVPGHRRPSPARSCTPSSGPRTWPTPASGSWSSAAAPPPSPSSRRWPRTPPT